MSLIVKNTKYRKKKAVNFTMKSFLQNNDIEMSSTHNERKFVFAEKFIGTLKNKICKYKTSVSIS